MLGLKLNHVSKRGHCGAAIFITLCSFFTQFFRQTIEHTIAIIKSWCNISMDCSFRWSICQISTLVGEFPDPKKGFLNLMVNMGHHGVIGTLNNTQVSNSFRMRYTGLFDLNVVYRLVKIWADYHHLSFRVLEFNISSEYQPRISSIKISIFKAGWLMSDASKVMYHW